MKQIFRKLLISLVFLVNANTAFAQKLDNLSDLLTVSPPLRDALVKYWRYYGQDDWSSLYKLLHATQNKQKFIRERKRIKANPPVGYLALTEIALSDNMIFNLQFKRARLMGCANLLWRNGSTQWVEIFTFIDRIRRDWVVSSPVIFSLLPSKTIKPCQKNLTTLPIRIQVSARKTK